MLTIDQFKECCDKFFEIGKKALIDTKEHLPQLCLYKDGGWSMITIVDLPEPPHARFIKSIIQKMGGGEAYIFISESWIRMVRNMKEAELSNGHIHEYPDKLECLTLVAYYPGYKQSRIKMFEHRGENILFAEEEEKVIENDDCDGGLFGCLDD